MCIRDSADAEDKGRALDILCALCEASRWAAGAGCVFEDETHPDIDLQAADTAALLGWAWPVSYTHLDVYKRQE